MYEARNGAVSGRLFWHGTVFSARPGFSFWHAAVRSATVVIFGLPEGAKFKALAVGDAELHWKMDSWWCRKSASD